ncbi:MAG: AI-2E family transporter [Patescibacteria group bacterium]
MTKSRWFFLILSLLVLFLLWKIISPFVLTLVTASVAAIVVGPLEARLRKKLNRPRLSSFLATLGVFLVIFVPLLLISFLMFDQVSSLIQNSDQRQEWPTLNELKEHPAIASLPEFIRVRIQAIDIQALGQQTTVWIGNNIGYILRNAASLTVSFVFSALIFFLSLYYILLDRLKIADELLILSPLKDSDDHKIIKRIVQTVRAVVFGSLIVALVQATMATIGMAIFGIPGFLVWGAMAIVAAQVPMLGVGLVMAPAVIYLLLLGHTPQAIGLLIWAVVMVGMIDNFLGPYLIEGRTRMHALMILLSILGGLQLFGPIGLVIGPTVLAAALVMMQLYQSGILKKK